MQLRFSQIDPGQVTGCTVTLPGHTGLYGTLLWYGGGRLAAGLTLPGLRQRWSKGTVQRSGAPEFTALYRRAARRAAAAMEHIRR